MKNSFKAAKEELTAGLVMTLISLRNMPRVDCNQNHVLYQPNSEDYLKIKIPEDGISLDEIATRMMSLHNEITRYPNAFNKRIVLFKDCICFEGEQVIVYGKPFSTGKALRDVADPLIRKAIVVGDGLRAIRRMLADLRIAVTDLGLTDINKFGLGIRNELQETCKELIAANDPISSLDELSVIYQSGLLLEEGEFVVENVHFNAELIRQIYTNKLLDIFTF